MDSFKKFYKSFIKETPDFSYDSEGEGIQYNTEPTAITFHIEKRTGESLWAKTMQDGYKITHASLVSWNNSKDFRDTYEEAGIEVHNNFSKESSERMKMNALGDTRTGDGTFIAGRVFKKSNVIAFWNSLADVQKNSEVVKKFIDDEMGMDSNTIEYDVIDIDEKQNVYGVFGTMDVDEERLSPEEVKELLSRQHLDPKAKKKLRQNVLLDDEDDQPKSKLPLGWNVFSRFSESVEHK